MTQGFGPYQVGETIGRGTFAKVKIAVHESTRTKVALKIISRKSMEQDARSNIKLTREIQILKLLRHPNIMRLYDVVQTKHDIVLILEYISGGELFDLISLNSRMGEGAVRHYFQQIVAAVAYIHRHRVVHRDIKPENIMIVRGSNTIKVCDFGLSSISHDGCFFETSCGTPSYASPEIISGKHYAGPETDVWSCGVVLYTMLAGALPFDEQNIGNLFKVIQTATYTTPSFFSDEAKDLLRRMLVVNPLERATLEQVMQHPWVRPEFPPYLLSLYYKAISDAEGFGRLTLLTHVRLDESIVEAVATRLEVSQEEVISIVARHEEKRSLQVRAEVNQGSAKRRRYPAEKFFELYSNTVDAKIWPLPLVIPPAEQVLRDREHNVYVSYLFLLQSVLDRMPLAYLSCNDPWSEAAGSHILSQSMSQGYGSLNANSLHQVSFSIASQPRSIQSSHQQGSSACARVRGNGGNTFFSSLYANVQPEEQGDENVDLYMEGYNRLAEAFLPLYGPKSKHTLLGMLLGVVEHSNTTKLPHSVVQTSSATSEKVVDGNFPVSLLKPIPGGAMVNTTTPSIPSGGKLLYPASNVGKMNEDEQLRERFIAAGEDFSFRSPLAPSVFQCGVTARFGNNFIRNGVLFSPSDPPSVLRHVYSAMKGEGLLWKSICPYYFAAIMHPSVKLQVRIYKITTDKYIVDVKISSQSGMSAYDIAFRLLDRLRRNAISDTNIRSRESVPMVIN